MSDKGSFTQPYADRLATMQLRLALILVALASLGGQCLSQQLAYDRTTFLHGFASGPQTWTDASTPQRLSAQVDLGPNPFQTPRTSAGMSITVQRDQFRNLLAGYGDRNVLVGHSNGGLVARAAYVLDRTPQITAIATTGTPHYGTQLANNINTVVAFFTDVQRRVDDAWFALGMETGGFTWMLRGTQSPFAHLSFIDSLANSRDAVNDDRTDSPLTQSLSSQTNDPIPHASVYGTIPNRHAVVRLAFPNPADIPIKAHELGELKSAYKTCKVVGHVIIVFLGNARVCSYGDKVLGRIDARWALYAKGTRSEAVKFDGIVEKTRAIYPPNSDMRNTFEAELTSHTQLTSIPNGVQALANAMAALGMARSGFPPVTVTIAGPYQFSTTQYLTYSASAYGGNGSYSYTWNTYDGSGVTYRGSGSTITIPVSSSTPTFDIEVVVSSGGTSGSAAQTVSNNQSQCGTTIIC
jgi:pimeloyl-ACP methyl ester carboxylesterase